MNENEVIGLALKWVEEIKAQAKNDKKVVENGCYIELMGVLSTELFANHLIDSLNRIESKETKKVILEMIITSTLRKINRGLKE